MARLSEIELTMMVMIENDHEELLLQDRKKKDWPGWTFPGGHVENDEGVYEAAKREIAEETGLVVSPILKGTVEWNNPQKKTRELAFLYTAFVEKQPVAEDLVWIKKEKLSSTPLAGTLGDLLPVFFGTQQQLYFDVT